MAESETGAALRRAAKKAAFHLLRAALEGVKAIEVFVDELGTVGRGDKSDPREASGPVHIEIE